MTRKIRPCFQIIAGLAVLSAGFQIWRGFNVSSLRIIKLKNSTTSIRGADGLNIGILDHYELEDNSSRNVEKRSFYGALNGSNITTWPKG
jgi:hypothetical protein